MFSPAIKRYLLFWLVVSGVLFIVPMLHLGKEAASYYSNLLQIASSIVSTMLCIRTARVFERGDPMRLVWICIGAGVLSWGIGQMLFTGYIFLHNGAETPYPWFSDIGFLLIQPFMVFALFIFAKAMAVRPPTWGIVISLLLLIATLVLAFETSQNNLASSDATIKTIAIIAYILFDPILIAATVLSASMLAGGLLARPWWYCFGGLVLYYLSNRIYEIEIANNTYVSGSWVDLGWTLAFILIGTAAILYYEMLRQDE